MIWKKRKRLTCTANTITEIAGYSKQESEMSLIPPTYYDAPGITFM
jgi:hypothetical protein